MSFPQQDKKTGPACISTRRSRVSGSPFTLKLNPKYMLHRIALNREQFYDLFNYATHPYASGMLNGPSPPEMMPPVSAQRSELSCGPVAYLTGKTFLTPSTGRRERKEKPYRFSMPTPPTDSKPNRWSCVVAQRDTVPTGLKELTHSRHPCA